MSAPLRLPVPKYFQEIVLGRCRVWVRPEASAWVEELLASEGALYEGARTRAREEVVLGGRAPLFVVPAGSESWVVRHYVRGGSVASLLGDRYIGVGIPRPFLEAAVSERLRASGLPTPKVLAAAVYPSGAFYRGDLVTQFVAGAQDLAGLLFQDGGGAHGSAKKEERILALERVGALVRKLGATGLRHPDLNAKNFLVERGASPPRVYLLDLDGCRAGQPSSISRWRMERRLRSSLSKWERLSGRSLAPEEWAALAEGMERGATPY